MKLKPCFDIFRPWKINAGDLCAVVTWPKISWKPVAHRFEALECDFKLSLNEFWSGEIMHAKE